MQKLISAMTAIVVLFVCSLYSVQAQTEVPKFEIGAHYSYLSLGSLGLSFPPSPTFINFTQAEKGVGGRATFNLTNHIAIESEINFFRNSRRFNTIAGLSTTEYSREPGIQGLFGPKIGIRTKKIGFFGKVRPGFLRYVHKIRFDLPNNVPAISSDYEYRTSAGFALDLGGVVEVYPSRHTVFRFDIGDTIIRYRTAYFNFDGTPLNNFPRQNFTNHNLQFNVGFGIRF